MLAGGEFRLAAGVRTCQLAAVDPATGRVDRDYVPQPTGAVAALLRADERLYAGGAFPGFGLGQQISFGALPALPVPPPPGLPTMSADPPVARC